MHVGSKNYLYRARYQTLLMYFMLTSINTYKTAQDSDTLKSYGHYFALTYSRKQSLHFTYLLVLVLLLSLLLERKRIDKEIIGNKLNKKARLLNVNRNLLV